MRVGIVGLGYVGLPLAVAFAAADVDVLGVDLDEARVAAVAAGRSYVEDVSAEALAAARRETGTCLIYVPVTPGSVMKGFSWWDVPPAAISSIPAVRAARRAYDKAVKKQRFHY